MKKKMSISIDENTILEVKNIVETGDFRNSSHLIETAVNKLLKEIKDE